MLKEIKKLKFLSKKNPNTLKKKKKITGSTVGMFEVLLLFLPIEDTNDEVWLSSKSPLTLLEGDVALLLFKAMTNP